MFLPNKLEKLHVNKAFAIEESALDPAGSAFE
jgi:hypothetical protein